jgi:hypothetical protein
MMQDCETKEPLVSFREAFELYENGKHRRYELLFAVNGGAFAVAKVIGPNRPDLGKLHLPQLALVMILFTLVMVYDIYKFGDKWHKLGLKISPSQIHQIFGPPGRAVLFAIGSLLCAGWALAAWQP